MKNLPKRNLELVFLFIFFLVGAILRFERLHINPPALNWDEVSHGWNAYSLLETGKDEWGEPWPNIFRAFGDYKLPLYIYLTMLPIKLFGLTALAARFISAFSGSLAILGIYYLANVLAGDLKLKLRTHTFSVGLLAALALALTPWHFFVSRPALEANLSLTLIIFGFAFLLAKKPLKVLIGLGLLALSLHAYNSARVFVPLLLLVTILIYWRSYRLHWGAIVGAFIFSLSLGLVAAQIQAGTGLARYEKLAILSEAKVFEIGQLRQISNLTQPLPRLLYNRPVFFIRTFIGNYLNYYSPAFLYQRQGAQYQFAVPGAGLLGIPILIFGVLGIIYALVRHTNSVRLLLAWFLLAPVPAALTLDPPQALRPLYLIAAWAILAALGIRAYLQIFNAKPRLKQAMAIAMVIVLAVSFSRYWRNYWQFYRVEYAGAWQDGYHQLWQYLLSRQDMYQHIVVTKRLGEPHIFLAFYGKLPPESLWLGNDNVRFGQSDWFWTDRVGKFYFANDWDITPLTKEYIRLESGSLVPVDDILIVASPGQLPQSVAKIEEINDSIGTVVFDIGERR